MKSLLLLGGLFGFGIALNFNWTQESAWPALLGHVCVAASLAGLLMKGWGRAGRKNLAKAPPKRSGLSGHSSPPSALHKS